MFPTTAGDRWTDEPVYPRVCGGTPVNSRQDRKMIGSIPACAGEPTTAGSGMSHGWIRVYPRVCGGTCTTHRLAQPCLAGMVYPRVCGGTDVLTSAEGMQWVIGLSPRVRGNRLRACVPPWNGSIPACAGEPARQPESTAMQAVGLSPRVRGNLPSQGDKSTNAARQTRSIPACAGEPYA